jgi:GNAT superfamily N-acetyltransferase
MTLQIRAAATADVEAAAGVLADAFAQYAWTRWTVDADRHAARLRRLYEVYLARVALPHGEVDLGETAEGLVAVAVWVPGGAVPDEVWSETAPVVRDLAGNRAAAADEADTALEPHRPRGAHIVLASVGVVPDRQGRGHGRAVLEQGLARADRAELPVHLETSDHRNVDFYLGLGFEVTACVDVPGGGPRTWVMRRGRVPEHATSDGPAAPG